MKKVMQGVMAAVILASGAVYAESKVFSIDSSRLLKESREGRSLLGLNEKDKEVAMKQEYDQSRKIAELRGNIEEGLKTGTLSGELLQEKYENLGRQQRQAKHVIEDAREDLELSNQKRILAFRNKVFKVAGEVFKKESCSFVFDKGAPGVIFVADSSDKTDSLLKELNVRYEKERAKFALTKGTNKKA